MFPERDVPIFIRCLDERVKLEHLFMIKTGELGVEARDVFVVYL